MPFVETDTAIISKHYIAEHERRWGARIWAIHTIAAILDPKSTDSIIYWARTKKDAAAFITAFEALTETTTSGSPS